MPKLKTRLKQDKKAYLLIAIGIFISLFCFLLLGRVGKLSIVYLFLMFILGDYTSVALIFIAVVCFLNLVLNKPIDLHHIYVIGGIIIYLGLSLLCLVGIYDQLGMTPTTILSKTFELYSHYVKAYERGYSVGGGIIATLIASLVGLVSGKIGISLVAVALIAVGLTYIININFFKIFKGGRIKALLVKGFGIVRGYFKGIHYPYEGVSPSVFSLKDTNEPVSFTLQHEINSERLEELKKYISERRVTCMVKDSYTSYTSSRFIAVLPHKSEYVIGELTSFFNRNCFFIKNDLELYIEITNQFKKLLTLKHVLSIQNDNLAFGLDVDGTVIGIPLNTGKSICFIGDEGSGLKTIIRAMLTSLLIKKISAKNIYFYDLNLEFLEIEKTHIRYCNTENDTSLNFDEAFNEYERRMEAIKYLGTDDIISANKKIEEMGKEYDRIETLFEFIVIRNDILNEMMLQKLSYVMQFGVKVGMIIFLFCREKEALYRINLAGTDLFSLRINDVGESIKLFGTDIACRLQKKGDFLYQVSDKLYHGQSPYISIDDFDDVISKI